MFARLSALLVEEEETKIEAENFHFICALSQRSPLLSHHCLCSRVPPQVSVVIDRHPVRFFVHKRPHVDFFLDIVSQWYDLVVFTASMEIYGAAVADKLDNGRNILNRR